jgi:hypothetical protein
MVGASVPPRRLTVGLAALYAASFAALWLTRRTPSIPWTFLPFMAVVCAPLAVTLYGVLAWLPRERCSPLGPAGKSLCILAGTAVTYVAHTPLWLVPAIFVAALTCRRWTLEWVIRSLWILATVVLGYACVWNLNYVFAPLTVGRLHDPWLVSLDTKLLSTIISPGADYDALFPLIRDPIGFRLLENSYVLLFPEVITVLLVTVSRGSNHQARLLCALFGMYAVGLGVFLVLPTAGPPIYHPPSFDARFHHTLTFSLMEKMATEYRHAVTGGALTGFGYFVAIPSLHVAAAVLMQQEMRPYPYLYWTWLPMNTLLVLSTVLLGYHYLLDVPAGYCLGWLTGRYIRRQAAVAPPMHALLPADVQPERSAASGF